jgi:hypothetical protein
MACSACLPVSRTWPASTCTAASRVLCCSCSVVLAHSHDDILSKRAVMATAHVVGHGRGAFDQAWSMRACAVLASDVVPCGLLAKRRCVAAVRGGTGRAPAPYMAVASPRCRIRCHSFAGRPVLTSDRSATAGGGTAFCIGHGVAERRITRCG